MYKKTRIQKQSTLLHPASRRKTLDSQGQFVETEGRLRHGRRGMGVSKSEPEAKDNGRKALLL